MHRVNLDGPFMLLYAVVLIVVVIIAFVVSYLINRSKDRLYTCLSTWSALT